MGTGAVLLPGGVWIGGEAAYLLTRPLKLAAAEARKMGAVNRTALGAIRAIELAGEQWQAGVSRCADETVAGRRAVIGVPLVEMTTAELAQHLNVSPQAIRQRAARGTLSGRKVAGRWLFDTPA